MPSIEDIFSKFQQVQKKEVSQEAVKVLGDREKIKRFSFIERDERDMLFRFLAVEKIFFPRSSVISNIVNDYLELSLSIDCRGSQNIVDLFKTEIQTNIENAKKE